MVKKTVLKVHIACQKCKKKLIQAVSGLEGIDKIEIDSEKSTLTVIGNADPVDVIKRTRKAEKFTEVMSIGPPPAPPKPVDKKPDDKKPDQKKPEHPPLFVVHMPPTCQLCHQLNPQICTVL